MKMSTEAQPSSKLLSNIELNNNHWVTIHISDHWHLLSSLTFKYEIKTKIIVIRLKMTRIFWHECQWRVKIDIAILKVHCTLYGIQPTDSRAIVILGINLYFFRIITKKPAKWWLSLPSSGSGLILSIYYSQSRHFLKWHELLIWIKWVKPN